MAQIQPQNNTIIFGFDSAWVGNAPGAICAIAFNQTGDAEFIEPRLVSFDEALAFIEERRHGYDFSLVALDQPTIVPNMGGSRPVEKVAGSLVSFVGGGVQPANRSKEAMFGDKAPIWPFLLALGASESPIEAKTVPTGHHLIEVFPALALPSLNPNFAGRKTAPKYNPQNRRTFQIEHWQAVAKTVATTASTMGIEALAIWAEGMARLGNPRKSDQDKLDASICVLIGLIWRAGVSHESAMIGDTETGYMITPISDATTPRLIKKAMEKNVPFVR